MSNKKQGLQPKLRFPEFRESARWEIKKLEEFGKTFLNGGTPSTQIAEFWQGSIPWITGADVVNQKIEKVRRFITKEAVKNSATNVIKEGSLLVVTRTGVGKVAIAPFDLAISQDLTGVYIDEEQVIPNYLYRFFDSSADKLKSLNQGTSIAGITRESLIEMKIPVPSTDEQQKIADCLTSVDELITAEAQQIEALKAHKKGLLQQLFPVNDETTPSLRFPEFRESGDWVDSSLGEISNITSGGTPSRLNKEFWNGNIPWVTTSLIDFNIIDNANEYISESGLKESSAKLFPKSTILMAMYGQGKTRGKVAILGIEATTNQACAAILLKKELLTSFVFQNLTGRYDEIRKLSNKGGQENLSIGLIETIPLSYPIDKKEQKKIADCLSSLDELITAHTQKLEALKTHKKGLMQQLFPPLNEVQE